LIVDQSAIGNRKSKIESISNCQFSISNWMEFTIPFDRRRGDPG